MNGERHEFVMRTNHLLVRLIEEGGMHIIECATESFVREHSVEQIHAFVLLQGETTHDQQVGARLRYILQELFECGPAFAVAVINGRILRKFVQTEILQHGRFERAGRVILNHTEARFVHVANGDGRKW